MLSALGGNERLGSIFFPESLVKKRFSLYSLGNWTTRKWSLLFEGPRDVTLADIGFASFRTDSPMSGGSGFRLRRIGRKQTECIMVLFASERLSARDSMVISPSKTREPIVYIVDDDAAVCRAVEMMVKAMNLQGESYTSAETFIEAYDPTRPGCVLLDVRIGEVSGLELLERLMQEQLRLPAIVISAFGDVPTAVRAMKAGALKLLEK